MSLVAASWLAVRRPPLLVPLGVAVLVVGGTVPLLDDGYATEVLHGVGLLVACAMAGATDDPSAEVVAAAPRPRWVRTLARLLVGVVPALLVLLVAVALAGWRAGSTPALVAVSEAVGLVLVAVAVGAVLRALGRPVPAYPAMVGLVLLWAGSQALPRGWVLLDPQPWGPPLEAALLRWAAVALLALGVLCLALRDPAR
jgi:hypothetical protein